MAKGAAAGVRRRRLPGGTGRLPGGTGRLPGGTGATSGCKARPRPSSMQAQKLSGCQRELEPRLTAGSASRSPPLL
eukprot:452943-Alexandrium_andersonii.AAC.1